MCHRVVMVSSNISDNLAGSFDISARPGQAHGHGLVCPIGGRWDANAGASVFLDCLDGAAALANDLSEKPGSGNRGECERVLRGRE